MCSIQPVSQRVGILHTFMYIHAGLFKFEDSTLLQVLNCGLILTWILPTVKIASPLVYQLLPCDMLRQFCSGLPRYFWLGGHFIGQWLFLPTLWSITPLVVDVITLLWLNCLDLFQHLCYGASFIHWLMFPGTVSLVVP